VRKVITAFILTALLAEPSVYASIKSTGIPFVENYPKEAYHAGTQVWSIDQDENGIMYFGNNSGLLTFDSQSWRLYPVPNRSIVRSVAVSTDGKIYVGCFNDFGFFAPDERGELVYTSLLNKVPVEYRDFGEVWNIMFYKNGIIFHSYNAVFFLFDQAITIISYNRDLHFSFNVNEDYYVKENGRGILKLKDSGLEMVKHSEFFAGIVISSILPFNEAELMILTREEGIYLLGSDGVKPFETEWQDFFKKHQIYSARLISDEYYILGTVQNGVVIIDKKGKLVQHLNRNRGLQNNTVLSLFTDHSDNLWMGLDNGIDFVMTSSPLSYIAHESEVGAAYAVTHKGSDLYIGTNQGLYLATWPQVPVLASAENDFQFVQGSQGQVWAIKNTRDNILVGHDKGTFIAERNSFTNLSNIQGGWNFIEVPAEPGIIIEGTYTGLLKYRLEKQDNRSTWKFVGIISGFSESCRQIQFDQKGYLWVGHGYRGVYRLKLSTGLDSILEIRHYAKGTGLPSSYQLNVLKFNREVIVSSNGGIFSYNYEKDSFERNKDLSELFDNKNVQSLIEDQSGNIWYFSEEEVGILKSNYDGSYSKITKPFNPIHNKLIATYENVYSIDRSNILFSTEEGVIHFDPNFKKDYKEAFGVAIRKVEILPYTLLYGGYPSGITPVEIRFKDNGLRFTYSALTYEFSKNNEYSIMLEGFDKDWSEWSLSAEKEYTNLQDGEYRFRVRGRNIYGYENESEPFVFLILPPWYRSTLAYLLYILLFIIFVIIAVRIVIRKIEKEKYALHEKQKADLKAREKLYNEEALKAEQEIIKLQNEKLEAENQKNLTELESKTKELASVAMQITYKNELLNSIKQKLIRVSSNMIHQESKKQVSELIKTLEKDIITQDEWERFEVHFDQVHEDFMKKLRHNYTELTPKDLRLCAYLRMNLSSKEVAPLLNISVRGVEISRYRLRKKMGLPRDTNLTDFMMKL
jgi:ligand-binding sensor domain-containing protein/DNA-binding CsgD family transcriptional regulator